MTKIVFVAIKVVIGRVRSSIVRTREKVGIMFDPGKELGVSYHGTEEKVVVLRPVTDELDREHCPELRDAVDAVLRIPSPFIVLDLSAVEYLDSSGLGVILSLQKQSANQDRTLYIISNETVDNILALTRLTSVFKFTESVENVGNPEPA